MNLKNYLLKKLLKWANKKCKNFNIYNVVFFVKKIKKNNTWRYRYFTHVYQISSWYELQFLRYRVPHTEIGSYGSFFGLLPLPLLLKTKKKKKQNFEMKKLLQASSFHTHLHMCTKNHNHMRYSSWDTDWDRIFCHFGPYFTLLPHYWPQKLKFGNSVKKHCRHYPFTPVHHEWRSCDVWFLRYKGTTDRFWWFWATFCSFTLLTIRKTKILKKFKKRHGDIILHLRTKNDNRMMYGSWDMECNRHNFLSFWTIFCPITP